MNKRCGSSGNDRGKWQGRRRGRGHGRGMEHQNSVGGPCNTENGTRDKSHIKCFTCSKIGHYAFESHGKGRDDEAHLTCTVDEEPSLMMAMS
ncbi:keratin, type I cytoskeletal 9-like [Cucumis melo var. makuwa]|uniref:Keratin, type I cytoskeletal 9-like n=1 Tax=Cucumis melo var. makuwa TaxID=1194695 RepID=A0A5D3B747_CUCMM|nr:keratin, type I cytoskeletal 9-like [Cucumis melo var. makuwa]TYJ95672.1 keratin, type I cytoskeletal 9-like [Cucumis melo var. makuwa]